MESCSVQLQLHIQQYNGVSETTDFLSDGSYFLHYRPWVKKGIFSSFFPALDLPVARYDVEHNVKQTLQDTSYQILEIWQHWTPTQ